MCAIAIVLSIIYWMVLLLVLQDDYLEKAKPTTNVSYFFTQSKIGTDDFQFFNERFVLCVFKGVRV